MYVLMATGTPPSLIMSGQKGGVSVGLEHWKPLGYFKYFFFFHGGGDSCSTDIYI